MQGSPTPPSRDAVNDTAAVDDATRRFVPYDTGGCAAPPPSRRSHHVSRACVTCRRRKTKCDGKEPACGTCRVHGIDCEYSTEPDRRKTRDAHAAIASLQEQVDDLRRQIINEREMVEQKLRSEMDQRLSSLINHFERQWSILGYTAKARSPGIKPEEIPQHEPRVFFERSTSSAVLPAHDNDAIDMEGIETDELSSDDGVDFAT